MHGTKRTRRKNGREYINHRYICSGYSCKGICQHNAIRADELHPLIVREIIKKFENPETVVAIQRELAVHPRTTAPDKSKEVDRLRRELKQASTKLKVVTQRIGIVPDKMLQSVLDEMSELTDRRDRIQNQLEEAKRMAERSSDVSEISSESIVLALRKLSDNIKNCPKEGLSKLLASMIDRVELRFRDVPYGKRTIRRLSGGKIHLKKSSEFSVGGTGFEPASSRL